MSGSTWLWDGGGSGVYRSNPAICAGLPEAGADGWPDGRDAVFVWGAAPLPACWRNAANRDDAGGSRAAAGFAAEAPNPPGGERPAALWILNAGAASAASLPETEWRRRLRRCGMAAPERPPADVRRYRVAVFHLEAVHIRRLLGGFTSRTMTPGSGWTPDVDAGRGIRLQGGGNAAKSPLLRRLGAAAVSAVYALGLDAASVDLDMDDNDRIFVRQFRLPGAEGRPDGEFDLETDVILDALRKFADDYRSACSSGAVSGSGGGVLLGADPEFVLLKADGRIASAARLGGLGSPVGSDVVLSRRRLVHPVAELRPEPADNPQRLAANVRRLLGQAAALMGEAPLRMLAGAMPVPGLALGGHLHLSGVWLSSRLLRALDSYVALPLAMAEDPRGRARRPRYGMLGDFRMQPHGGFEYRTLPSWLVSPVAAKAAFAFALLAAEDMWTLRFFPSLDEPFAEAYYAGNVPALRGCLDGLEREIRSAPSYSRYAVWIDPFLRALRQGGSWDETVDIRDKWRLRKPAGPLAAEGAER
ncbi:putative amidoligase domain-containing protein [Paenibacillus beijingensis]|uniref:putative amidoligase domain-containing protein n=1 Tax=Paenibacillus beijingensis TaxID=1126833 RepID=UPI0006962B92|nr:hypothetical protein [Paenibacillus beijingensis]